MVENYLIGLVGQSLARTRQLRSIVQRQYPREYDDLRRLCLNHLENIQAELQSLAQETVVDSTLQTPLRVRRFKRIVEQLNSVEGIGVFALSRISKDDRFLNRFTTRICSEIAFPLRPRLPVTYHRTISKYTPASVSFAYPCWKAGSSSICPTSITNCAISSITVRISISPNLKRITPPTCEVSLRW